jgi:G3E family GTPase
MPSTGNELLPISLLTGFLGSGKTTLLRRALMSPEFSDTAVVINEFGEIALDHYLVAAVDAPVLELPGGCLCCAIREDLASTLRGLVARREEGACSRFRRIVVETTGLADPAPILFTMAADATLEEHLRLDRVVATVDTTTALETLARYAEAERQIALADRLVVTKTDLAPCSERLRQRIAMLNPVAEPILGADAQDLGGILWGSGLPTTLRPLSDAIAAHTHGVAAYGLILRHPCSRLEFARALGELARDRGEDLLRVKGILEFADRPGRPAFVQGAQHAIYPPIWLDQWPDQDRRSRLQFIVNGISLEDILESFAFAAAELHRPSVAVS